MPNSETGSEPGGLAPRPRKLPRFESGLRLVAAALLGAAFGPTWAIAQTSTEVVQPLPPAGVAELNNALRRLARNSQNVGALLDAGDAALRLNDTDAAIGFFGRANELSPNNSRVKMGLASAYVRRESPLQALRLFDEAERAGVSSAALAGDRGLAYDLVGDSRRAQSFYYQALTLRPDEEVSRRLALSQAIAGDRKSFEATLLPLLQRQDMGAFRIRSFGLAIMGEDKEAIKIAEAIMPRNLSRRLKPYLRYMDRLTPAQQAAAAHFGNFPQTAQIGQDDPRIASYSPSSRTGQTASAADRSLTPQGEPLGPSSAVSDGPTVTKGRSEIKVTTLPQVAVAELPPTTPVRAATTAPASVTISEPVVQAAPDSRATQVTAAVEGALQTAGQLREASARPSLAVGTPEPTAMAVTTPIAEMNSEPEPVPVVNINQPFGPGRASAVVQGAAPASTASAAPPATQAASVADAFSDFKLTPSPAATPAGGVDITAIKPPVEVAEKAAPEPVKSENPRRYWVQVATGKDRSALSFDWRRLSRKAPDLLGKQDGYLASWNQTNRLVTGPFKTLRAARDFVTQLGKADVDSFTFTSAEDEKVDPLS